MSKKDAKYIGISSLLHITFFILVGMLTGHGGKGKGGDQDGKDKKAGILDDHDQRTILAKQITEVTIVETAPKKGPGLKKLKVQKIEKREKSKYGYYGIGIYIRYSGRNQVVYNGQTYEGIEVGGVIYGNPAFMAGFIKGDIIFMVNGKQYGSINDTRGPKAKDLVIGVKRGDEILFIKLRSDWIETGAPNKTDILAP